MSKELGFILTPNVLKSFLKKLGYSWKRFKKSLKSKQDAIEYEAKKAKLKELIKLHKSGYIDLFFADESGFSMEGNVPYGWQPKGEYIEITPSKSKRINVFGLMSLDNRLEAYSFKGSGTSLGIISFIDDFATNLKRKTAIVLDNAPIHHSAIFDAKIAEWEEMDLYVFFLPPYSPHLNPIEILWRKIKYEWLEYENIATEAELEEQLVSILNSFGSERSIDFKELKVSII